MKLKTLKDLIVKDLFSEKDNIVRIKDLKQEAIKWIKEIQEEENRFYCTICTEFNCDCLSSDCFKIYYKDDLITWIKHFFYITEDDLK